VFRTPRERAPRREGEPNDVSYTDDSTTDPEGEGSAGSQGARGLGAMKWEQRKYTAKDFNPGMNIGLRHDTRAAIDLDCPEAIKVAGRFLPPTDTSGKERTPDSHWWYEPVNGEPPYKKFTDNTITILELRFGSNKQTVIPRASTRTARGTSARTEKGFTAGMLPRWSAGFGC
jgi:hypothetical protein